MKILIFLFLSDMLSFITAAKYLRNNSGNNKPFPRKFSVQFFLVTAIFIYKFKRKCFRVSQSNLLLSRFAALYVFLCYLMICIAPSDIKSVPRLIVPEAKWIIISLYHSAIVYFGALLCFVCVFPWIKCNKCLSQHLLEYIS